jgi:hypothetical protein
VQKFKNTDQVWMLLDSGMIRGMVIDYEENAKAYHVLGRDNEHYLIPANRLSPVLDTDTDN